MIKYNFNKLTKRLETIDTVNRKLLWEIAYKLCNIENFSEVKLNNYKQSNIMNLGNTDRGICGLTSILTSFEKYYNLSPEKISHYTNLPVKIRNDAKFLVEYFNKINPKLPYELKYESAIFEVLLEYIKIFINNNVSCVLTFRDDCFNQGHSVSIYKETSSTIGFIENADFNVTLFYLMQYYLVDNKNNLCKDIIEILDGKDIDWYYTNINDYKLNYLKNIILPIIKPKICIHKDNYITVNKGVLKYLSNKGLIIIKDKDGIIEKQFPIYNYEID